MKYDIESILEMYEDDYTPSAMVPGPRNMKLAEVSRSEMDNVNTPDLDQGADSILRPGETLEDFDVEFRRPNAQGGVQQLVRNTVDGSRPGYSGRKNKKISYDKENKIIKEYNTYLSDEIKSGNMSKSLGFKSWLRENKTPAVFEKTYKRI